jgi:hypothetical protein
VTTTRSAAAYCTTSSSTVASIATNLPRVESLGLLSEGAGGNLILQSQTFDNGSWAKLAGGGA